MSATPSIEERFWPKVDKGDGCWEWNASRYPEGYGQFTIRGKPVKAHRVSWFLAHGEWPTQHVLHHCDNPPCVRPDHLFEGSHADNMRDAASKGKIIGFQKGVAHPWARKLTPEQVEEIRSSTDKRAVLAERYGVHWVTISRVKNGRAWPKTEAGGGPGEPPP